MCCMVAMNSTAANTDVHWHCAVLAGSFSYVSRSGITGTQGVLVVGFFFFLRILCTDFHSSYTRLYFILAVYKAFLFNSEKI